MKKKGFTLIEVIIYISIASLLITLMMGLVIKLISFRKEYLRQSIEEDFVTNSLIAISNELNDFAVDTVELENNETILIKQKFNKNSKIAIYGSDLAILQYNGHSESTVNKILKGVEDFEVIKKGKLLYIKINFEGSEYEEVFKM